MFRIFANDHHFAVAFDDLAFITDFFDRRFNFQSANHLSLDSDSLFGAPGDPPLRRVINGYFHRDLIAGQNLDIIHSQFPGDVRRNDHLIGQLYLEGSIG